MTLKKILIGPAAALVLAAAGAAQAAVTSISGSLDSLDVASVRSALPDNFYGDVDIKTSIDSFTGAVTGLSDSNAATSTVNYTTGGLHAEFASVSNAVATFTSASAGSVDFYTFATATGGSKFGQSSARETFTYTFNVDEASEVTIAYISDVFAPYATNIASDLTAGIQVNSDSYPIITTFGNNLLWTFALNPGENSLTIFNESALLQNLGSSDDPQAYAQLATSFDFSIRPVVSTPTPEPATWGMMIIGLAIIGAKLRRATAAARRQPVYG